MDYSNIEDFKKQALEALKNGDNDFLYYVVPEQYTLKLASYASMKNDLFFLLDAVHKLIDIHQQYKTPQENPEIVIEGGLWYAIIVTYAKLYTDSEHKSSKLEEKDVFDTLDETADEFYRTHKELMHHRNNFVAHRGKSVLDSSLIFLKIPKSGNLAKASFEVKTVRAYGNGTAYFVKCLHLFRKIFDLVDGKMQTSAEKLTKNLMGKPLAFFDPYEV